MYISIYFVHFRLDFVWRVALSCISKENYKHLFSFTEICLIRMCDAEFHYTYEYQGNAAKLVHTPLTDKCYLTLTQGMHMGLGGNPYGPAGTGKTESVKALGGLFGRQVLVFNCDEVRMKTYVTSDVKVDLEYKSVKSHIRDFALSFLTTITSFSSLIYEQTSRTS